MKSLASAKVLADTRERLLRVTADDVALWGRMTATQMVGHLSCTCEAALGGRTMAPLKMPVPPLLMKFLALRTGMRWAKNIQTTPELRQAIAETTEDDFDGALQAAVVQLNALASAARCADTHPIFGAMTAADWMRWGYLHTDHHLRQFGR
jgi:Protein of unknown function (DUF1569)